MSIASASIQPAVIAFELIALADAKSKQGLSLRVLMDAAAARLMVAGMTGACTGMGYSNGEIAHWMAVILATQYPGNPADAPWAEARATSDREGYGAAYATRSSLDTVEATAAALRLAATRLVDRAGDFCVVEYGYCDMKGKGPGIADWAELHADKVIGRVAASDTMSTAFMIFTDQRAALKSAKAEAASPSHAHTPAAIIAAAVALESDNDD